MTPTLFSLLVITLGFTSLLLWVFWPSRREHLESLGQIPLQNSEEAPATPKTQQHDSGVNQ